MSDANRDVFDRGSLVAFLAQRARQASDLRLVLDAAAGFVIAVALLFFRPPLWLPLSALAFSLGAFGVWGILDREASYLSPGATPRRAVSVARALVAALGAVAVVLGGLSLFFALLGHWQS